jgi:heterodisulfide reductase subunit C
MQPGVSLFSGEGEKLMGKIVLSSNREAQEEIKAIESASGTRASLCYQCGKCSAGCPAAFAMDYTPRQIIRLLQLGLPNQALRANSIWICASCETCSTRCPRGVDIAAVMDALRRAALGKGLLDKDIAAFNTTFLNGVRRYGRLHEASLVLEYNTRIRKLFKDTAQAPRMLLKGKLKLFPEFVRGKKEVKRIFDRVAQMGGEIE